MELSREKGKSQQIAEAIEAEILSGQLGSGSRMRSVRELANDFSVSIRSVQIALGSLEEKGLIERKPGAGTFIKEQQIIKKDNTIYFLLPHPSHITLKYASSVMLRRILYGATSRVLPGQLVQPIPVTNQDKRDLSKNRNLINWANLERIPPGGNIFIGGVWYREIIPWLAGRSVNGVFLSAQYDDEYPETCEIIRKARWHIITIDRFNAIQQAVEYLHSLGRNRIAAIKRSENEPDHPCRRGFISAYAGCDMSFNDVFFREFPEGERDPMESIVLDLWKKTEFDALIVCCPDIMKSVFNVITKKIGLKVPEDVALISTQDMPEYLDSTPAISALDFPWVNMGNEIVNILNSEHRNPREIRFNASLRERGSTIKNSGGSFLSCPETISQNRQIEEIIR